MNKKILQKKPFCAAFIVGAGAIQNAWNPVVRALQPYYKQQINPASANCIFARIVYLLRWFASIQTDHSKEALQVHLQLLADIRVGICRELKFAQENNEISIRPEFDNIATKFLTSREGQFLLVSTNWDTVMNQSITEIVKRDCDETANICIHHIHGSIENPDTLYLPTELTREAYRNPSEDKHIGTIHGTIMRGLETANEVVLYGLSLSPLDAELMQTLATGWDNEYLEIISIIDPDHKAISERVNLLLRHNRKVSIYGYDPRNLERRFDYSIY